MNAQCPHKWWSTLKSAVFGSSSDSSLPPLTGAGGGICCADMLLAHFDGKQSRDPVDLPSTCHPSPSLTTFAFGSREVKRLLLNRAEEVQRVHLPPQHPITDQFLSLTPILSKVFERLVSVLLGRTYHKFSDNLSDKYSRNLENFFQTNVCFRFR